MLKIAIVDDHALMREGIKNYISSCSDKIYVVAEASNANELLSILKYSDVDLLIVDISMPGVSGISLIEHVSSRFPNINILVLSMHSDTHYVKEAFNAGCSGYVTKDAGRDELLYAINTVSSGSIYISPHIASYAITGIRDISSINSNRVSLSRRESEILDLIVSGYGNLEIAKMLFISSKTVSTYKTRIMKKLGVDNIPDLVRYTQMS